MRGGGSVPTLDHLLNSKKRPGVVTIGRLCDALALAFVPVVDAERAAIIRPQWAKRRK